MPGYQGLLRVYLSPQRRRLVVLACFLCAATALPLVNPQILRRFVDDAAAGASLEALSRLAALFLAVAVATQIAQLGETYVAENIGLTATNRLRSDLTLHVLRLDPSFHAAHAPGELIERTDGDVATLANFFGRLVVYLIGNGLLLVGTLVLLVMVDPRVGAVVSACSAIGVGVMVGLRRLAVPRHAALRQANAELFGLIEERLAGAEDVRANGGVLYVLRRLLERSRDVVWRGVSAQLVGGATFHVAGLCLSLGTVGGLAIAAYLFRQGELTIGTVFLIVAYSQSLRRPIENITRQLQDLQQATASVGRIGALLAERSVVVDGPGACILAGALSVDFDRVSFAYPGADSVLDGVSFRVEAGRVLGLLGRTGSGRTTIARLLFRLYDPTAGAIRLGGSASGIEAVDLRAPRLDELRARIGVVTQDVQLFHASVRDNITFFDPTVADERVAAALEEVGLTSWLGRLPDGLATRLAPGGGGLSAGEAQLLAFARVFLRDPGLVVLDEASSRLDPGTERLLEHAVDRLLNGRTAIVIAHRLATVARADQVLILEAGQVAETGDRVALAADPTSRFGRLLRAGRAAEDVLA